MTAKPVVPREQARRDVDDAVSHDLREAGGTVALGLVDALERAFRAIARNPAAGALRYAHELELPGLRTRALKRYPCLVFYVERDDHIDIWRVLHASRDIPASMYGPEDA